MLLEALIFAFRWLLRVVALMIVVVLPLIMVFGSNEPTQSHLAALKPRPGGRPLLVGWSGGVVRCDSRGCDHSDDCETQSYFFVPNDMLSGTFTDVSLCHDGSARVDRSHGAMYVFLAMYALLLWILVRWWRSGTQST